MIGTGVVEATAEVEGMTAAVTTGAEEVGIEGVETDEGLGLTIDQEIVGDVVNEAKYNRTHQV